MTPLRQRMIEALPLRGLSERTHEMYVRAVRPLADHSHKSPDRITEEELRDYFLYLKNVKHYSRAASPIALGGIQFFYEPTRQQPWTTLTFGRAPREQQLPGVLRVEEGHPILQGVRLPRSRACLSTSYPCGLRLQEGTHLQVPDSDRARMLVHVRCGKGAKDRYVPLPEPTLALLRHSWTTHRHPVWLCPAPGRSGLGMSTASTPMPRHSVQDACRAALKARGIHKRASVHTLRHSWATHLLEAGVNLRLIQHSLGQNSPSTTALSTHLTATADATATEAINRLLAALSGLGEPAMVELAEVVRRYGPASRAKVHDRLLPSPVAALDALEQCRTEALGGHLYQCADGGELESSSHSCTHRHCPKCQHAATTRWLEQQRALLLPVPYFLVTCPLPEERRSVTRAHQKLMDNLLLQTAAAALQALALAPRYLGGQLGMVGVLPTWPRDLASQPHVHSLVPGGALSSDGTPWLSPRSQTWLGPVRAPSRLFRGTFKAALTTAAHLYALVPPQVWHKDWVTPCQPAGSGTEVLTYFAPYISRIALTTNRLEALEDGHVTFRYTKRTGTRWPRWTLPAAAFIHRFLPHGLPQGFPKVRAYGLLSPSRRQRLPPLRTPLTVDTLTALAPAGRSPRAPAPPAPTRAADQGCRHGGGRLVFLGRLARHPRAPP